MSKQIDIALIGSGGHAKVVIATARAAGLNVTAVYDDDTARIGKTVLDAPIVGPVAELVENPRPAVIAIGSNGVRQRLSSELELPWRTVVHPSAVVHESVSLGDGTVVFANVVVQPDTRIGAHAILNTACSVDHDCAIGDWVHIAPGVRLCGTVTVGPGTLLGVGSAAIPGVSIGSWCTIGGGATVVRDLPDGCVALGTPATPVES